MKSRAFPITDSLLNGDEFAIAFLMQRIEPQVDQESVWDYPRPPRLELSSKLLRIVFNGQTIAHTSRAYRVLETSHPPVFYFPPEDVKMEFLSQTQRTSFCEWKDVANYYSIQIGEKSAADVAWFYANPTPEFLPIKGYLAFYPSKMDACFVDGEQVQAQDGDFYGGWITKEIVGPFKGALSTLGW